AAKLAGPTLTNPGRYERLALSPDGTIVCAVSSTGRENQKFEHRLWDTTTGRQLPYPTELTAVGFSADSQTLVTAQVDPKTCVCKVQRWEAASARPKGDPGRLAVPKD